MIALAAPLFQISRADVGRMLRGDALHLALGLVLVAVGIAAAAVYLARLRSGDGLLPWFGLFTFLYGLRLLARTGTFPLLFELPPRSWVYLAAAITYAIPVPASLILRAAFARWRRPLSWTAAGAGVFAAGAIAADAVLRRPHSAVTPNNLIAVAFLLAALVLLFKPLSGPVRDLRTLRIGLTALALTALVDNLRGLGLISWPRAEVEPLGSTVLIACLGTIAVRRALDNAQRLFALDKELGVARRIQSSILPAAMPQVAGIRVAARYHPMAASPATTTTSWSWGRGGWASWWPTCPVTVCRRR